MLKVHLPSHVAIMHLQLLLLPQQNTLQGHVPPINALLFRRPRKVMSLLSRNLSS